MGLKTMNLRTRYDKSNSNKLYRTSKWTSIHYNSMHYLPRGGGGESVNNVFHNRLLQIQFDQVL